MKVKAAISVLSAALLFVSGFVVGHEKVKRDWERERQRTTQSQSQSLLQGISEDYKLGLQHAQKQIEIRYVTNEIIKEIPIYMPDTRVCPVMPTGFSRLYNKAAGLADSDTSASGGNGTR